ncbi:hypothetical protein ROZALSC1DRAFT_30870 [Rozella allomycis CSF55]|uniref:Uncharacterized protein n=1 Tax=Rozella allomycis (strain CSF55) TaxID=988480 RepID=A0A4P9YDT8_ROZAC|nr:hypothetical protein ROZALSC1DRAFT_30870 [Rozella allomycis CSF55]
MMHFGGINPGFDTLIATSHLETNEPFLMFIEGKYSAKESDTFVTSTALKEKWSLAQARAEQLNLQLNQWCLVFIIYRMIPSNLHSQLADLEIDGVKVNNIVLVNRENVNDALPLELIRAVVNSNQNVEPVVAVIFLSKIIIAYVENPSSKKSKSSKD